MEVNGFTNPTSFGGIPAGWTVQPIETLCEKVTSGATPLRSNSEFYRNGSIRWFRTKELNDGYLDDSEEKITSLAVEKTSAKIFPPKTVLMAMYGDGNTITSLGILRKESATNQACCALIVNPKVCDYSFLFYSLKFHRDDFIRLATGGAQRNLSGTLIRNFAIKVPPLDEQKKIAHILGTLDDKIELNQQMNQTLEGIARALFKSWFIDFDPVRAKLDDRQPAGMDAETAALFPDSFDDSPLGKIPKGWKAGAADDIITILSGGTPKTSMPVYWNGNIPWFSVKDAPAESDIYVLETEKYITESGVSNSSTQVLRLLSSFRSPVVIFRVVRLSQASESLPPQGLHWPEEEAVLPEWPKR